MLSFRPTLLTKTPQEHLRDQWQAQANEGCSKAATKVPEGHIRVKLYIDFDNETAKLDEDFAGMSGATLIDDFKPEPDGGGLNLARVMRKWGMASCMAIDPRRDVPFQSRYENHLSSLAIATLLDTEGMLRVFEPVVPPEILRARQRRMQVVRRLDPVVRVWRSCDKRDVANALCFVYLVYTGRIWNYVDMVLNLGMRLSEG
ncbi:hypothetical protein CONPUDRAFT_165834 [Coniophora puteana RWD-64-598 SS2]|uniref:Uncharacterized protein n=1 Tax=Coniophora puteana (strain RWD-64-598) TaxID=741705 RepID=A0A5M3MMK4_CONPW|nr:uncharacterized protein CONPUDRAFT_165834 [Coniophora puteana RWD-64-598 SS2]EIW80257.1 hypothetical protein CONPUDRAFT_165834 [Coniophora puteana RWD-64-598 SS2]